eukprot:gnl/MRDRNA2_/MRDRNA2_86685_c0_seq11.p1 gnl/MRDRNA2_/MRDRNA2_86685_c0~~gnl/MRDRNA2_/MRDRNA2_86685_c0_seq11.p1  ORF type:complete len:2240 (-),score=404.77 gnl/MRDRNA2_/MRDRNA2_86685_c0_seq11:309-6086(-)
MMLIKSGAGHGNYEVDRLNDDLMLEAARRGDTSAVKERVKNGARATHMTKSGFSALSFAALHGDHEMAEALLEQLADPLSVGGGDVPIFKALEREYLEVAEVILRNMAELCKPGTTRTFELGIEMKASVLKVWAYLQKKSAEPVWAKLSQDFELVFENICGGVYSGLVWASKASSDSYCVQLLLEKKADSNAKIAVKSQWCSILDVAASHGALETVRQLVNFKAELGIFSRDGWEFSHVKTENGWVDKDIDSMPHKVDKKGRKRVTYPAQDYFKLKAGWGFKYAETTEEILSKDNGKLLDAYLEATRCQEKWWVDLEETLNTAAKRNAPNVVQVLLHCGARTDNTATLRGTFVNEDSLDFVLAVAVKLNATSFLSKFRDTYKQITDDGYDSSPVAKAVEACKFCGLQRNCASVGDSVPQAIFCEVAKEGNLNLLKKMLSQNLLTWGDLKEQNKSCVTKHMEMTAAHQAAAEGRIDVIQFLFEKKCSVRHANKSGRTPAGEAARRGHASMLVELNSDCIWNVKDSAFLEGYNKGHGLIAAAGYSGQAETIMALHNKNADVNKESDLGDTAAHLTAYSGAIHALKVLLDLKGDLTKKNKAGAMPVDDVLNDKTKGYLEAMSEERLNAFLNWKKNGEWSEDVPDENENVGFGPYKGQTMKEAWMHGAKSTRPEEKAQPLQVSRPQSQEGIRSITPEPKDKEKEKQDKENGGQPALNTTKSGFETAGKILSKKEEYMAKKFAGKTTQGEFGVLMVGGKCAGKTTCFQQCVTKILTDKFPDSKHNDYVYLNQADVWNEVFGTKDDPYPEKFAEEAYQLWKHILEEAIQNGYNVIVDDDGTNYKQWTQMASRMRLPGLSYSKRTVILVIVLCSSGVALKRSKLVGRSKPPIQVYAALDEAISIYLGMDAPYGSGVTSVKFDEIFVYDNNDDFEESTRPGSAKCNRAGTSVSPLRMDEHPGLKRIYYENSNIIPKETAYWYDRPGKDGLPDPTKTGSSQWWSKCLPQTGLLLTRGRTYDSYIEKVIQDYEKKRENLTSANNFVLMTAGGPGSGKSSVTKKFLKLMDHHYAGKGLLHYVDLNKDEILDSLFGNEIEYYDQTSKVFRDLRTRAIDEGFNLVVDGTGRNVQQWTTFADEIREANRSCLQKDPNQTFHRPVVLLITLASYDVAFKRCVSRLEETGRKVDVPYLRDVYLSMPNLIKTYLTTESWHFDRIFIVDNDGNNISVEQKDMVKLLYESSLEKVGSTWMAPVAHMDGFESADINSLDIGEGAQDLAIVLSELGSVATYKEEFFSVINNDIKEVNAENPFALFCISNYSHGGSFMPKAHQEMVDCYLRNYHRVQGKENGSSYLYFNEHQMIMKLKTEKEITKISAENVVDEIRNRAINDSSKCYNFAIHTSGLRVDKITGMADAVHRADSIRDQVNTGRKVILLILLGVNNGAGSKGQMREQVKKDTDFDKAVVSFLGAESFHFDEIAVIDTNLSVGTRSFSTWVDHASDAMDLESIERQIRTPRYRISKDVRLYRTKHATPQRSSAMHKLQRAASIRFLQASTKLILHFDVNGTVLVADPISNANLHAELNKYLAGASWGREVDGVWEFCAKTKGGNLTLDCPESDDAQESYYKYFERKMKDTHTREEFRAAVGRFTDEDGKLLKPHYNEIIQALRAPPELHETPFAFKQQDTWFYYVLPSFWRLLDELNREGRRFAIVLRTFGQDGPHIAKAINAFAVGRHPKYPNGCSQALLADSPYGCLCRSDSGIRLDVGKQDRKDSEDCLVKSIDNEVQIHKHFSELTGTFCVSDDYFYWKDKSFAAEGGKPVWFPRDPAARCNATPHHIFFDDNIRVDTPLNTIVDVRTLVSAEPSAEGDQDWESKGSCHPEVADEAGCLVQAALHESTLKPQYFVEEVRRCERMWYEEGTLSEVEPVIAAIRRSIG